MSRAPIVGKNWIKSEAPSIKGTVLNVGGGTDEQNLRELFSNASRYRILDIRKDVKPDIVADVQSMPEVPSESEDCILAHRMMCELKDVDAALKEFYRVLKHGGWLMASFVGPGWKQRGFRKFTGDEPKQLVEKHFKICNVSQFVEHDELRVTYLTAWKE